MYLYSLCLYMLQLVIRLNLLISKGKGVIQNKTLKVDCALIIDPVLNPIFLVGDQLDSPLFQCIYLFYFSTLYMFRALCAHPQVRQNCINTASGNC
jgi:hypothetical protein